MGYDEDDIYDGPDLVSPYQFRSVDPRVALTEEEKIVSSTLYAMTGPPWYAFFKKTLKIFQQQIYMINIWVCHNSFFSFNYYREPIFESERDQTILYHFDMETMAPTLEISTNVIDVWSHILNVMELYKEDTLLPSRYFFKISIIVSDFDI